LVDVVFLLLVFFLLAGTLDAPPIEVEPPASRQTAAQETQRLRVLLDANGRIAFDGRMLDIDSLRAAIAPRLARDSRQSVRIEADANVNCGRLLSLLEQLRSLGASRLALVTRPEAADSYGHE
jgi:biopolymer transport protein ExbD